MSLALAIALDCRLVTADERFADALADGDSWRHQVVVEKIGADSSDAKGAVCVSGERACPPEDCGGVRG